MSVVPGPFDKNPDEAKSSSNGNGPSIHDIDKKLIALETKFENAASKTDIAQLKVWVLSGVLGGLVEPDEGAYPNPFNSSVQIRYHLKEAGPVKIAIYSITGQRIRQLSADNRAQPGEYRLTWDGRSDEGAEVASGMYIVQVRMPSLVKSFKLSLIR